MERPIDCWDVWVWVRLNEMANRLLQPGWDVWGDGLFDKVLPGIVHRWLGVQ